MGFLKRGVLFSSIKLRPTQLVALSFTLITMIGAALLALPVSSKSGKATGFFDSLFTSASAVTVTGLSSVDTQTHWSIIGHVIIAVLVQIGGFGIVGFASLLGFLVEGRISLQGRISAISESSATSQPDIKRLLKNIALLMLFFEFVLFLFLFLRFIFEYSYSVQNALGQGIFHSITVFNQAGFALYSDSLTRFAGDPWILLPILGISFLAGLGFPVLVEIRDRLRLRILSAIRRSPNFSLPAHWSLNSRIVLWASFTLLAVGGLAITGWEWWNPETLGPLSVADKFTQGFFLSGMTRSTGLNTIDTGSLDSGTWLIMDVLMFIGGGSASTAGGIKLGTFVVLVFVIFTEIRGESSVNIGNRRLPRSMQRQAFTIFFLYLVVVISSTILLLFTTTFNLDQLLFEVISAAGTVGLTTGITPDLPGHAKFLLSLLMLFGRLGPILVATSMALKVIRRNFEYPVEKPLIG